VANRVDGQQFFLPGPRTAPEAVRRSEPGQPGTLSTPRRPAHRSTLSRLGPEGCSGGASNTVPGLHARAPACGAVVSDKNTPLVTSPQPQMTRSETRSVTSDLIGGKVEHLAFLQSHNLRPAQISAARGTDRRAMNFAVVRAFHLGQVATLRARLLPLFPCRLSAVRPVLLPFRPRAVGVSRRRHRRCALSDSSPIFQSAEVAHLAINHLGLRLRTACMRSANN
jgi:hypothetical protein